MDGFDLSDALLLEEELSFSRLDEPDEGISLTMEDLDNTCDNTAAPSEGFSLPETDLSKLPSPPEWAPGLDVGSHVRRRWAPVEAQAQVLLVNLVLNLKKVPGLLAGWLCRCATIQIPQRNTFQFKVIVVPNKKLQ